MRIFGMIGLLVSLLIIGWFAALYLTSTTETISEVVTQSGTFAPTEGGTAVVSPIDRAHGLASMDRQRQRQMERMLQSSEY